jgi:hypothetical protein
MDYFLFREALSHQSTEEMKTHLLNIFMYILFYFHFKNSPELHKIVKASEKLCQNIFFSRLIFFSYLCQIWKYAYLNPTRIRYVSRTDADTDFINNCANFMKWQCCFGSPTWYLIMCENLVHWIRVNTHLDQCNWVDNRPYQIINLFLKIGPVQLGICV